MTDFIEFKQKVQNQIDAMKDLPLFSSAISKEEIWDLYLSSYPEGSNPLFRERTVHDCNCCKNFIRNIGDMLAVKDNQLISVWDIEIAEPFKSVASALSNAAKAYGIQNIYLHTEPKVGTEKTPDMHSDIVWDHFFAFTPQSAITPAHAIGAKLGSAMSNQSVLKRSIEEISDEAVNTVIELIEQGSIYRGEEHLSTVKLIKECKRKHSQAENKETCIWEMSSQLVAASKIKNTVIGTLMEDISNGVDLEKAVKSFESKVAPANYKRPKAIVTEGMIKKAQQQVIEMGIFDSLPRRHANIQDISINDILFADRAAKKEMNVFDSMIASTPKSSKKFDHLETISIQDFINKVVPSAESIDLMLENRNEKNLVTLVAPVNKDSKSILKWDNNFSWTYNGEVADSLDQRVKDAGGNIDAFMRLTLAWDGRDDLDIHVKTPKGDKIYFGNRKSGGGELDVDANGGNGIMQNPVENVFWKSEPPKGVYEVVIDNFNIRSGNEGFTLKLVVGEHKLEMSTNQNLKTKVSAIKFEYLGNGEVKVVDSAYDLSGDKQVKNIWNLNTQNFHKVKLVMLSPNHWSSNENKTGNKHYFFMLEDCKNPDSVRGFYNEFLTDELNEHRKVFEMLASKMKAEYNEDQLSGVGFSSTKKDSVIVKVKGSFERMLKVEF